MAKPHSPGGPRLSAERHRTLVVGDGKQAIYRWRNGDYRQLLNLPRIVDDEEGAFADAQRTFHDALDDQMLESNWRSGRPLWIGTTGFLAHCSIACRWAFEAVYDDQTQTPERDFEGEVRIEAVHDSRQNDPRGVVLNDAVARLRHHASDGGRRSTGRTWPCWCAPTSKVRASRNTC